MTDDTSEEEFNEIASIVISDVIVTTILHPFDYARTLMKIGHEPISPWPTTTFFGNPALGLPNVFSYINYIYETDGFFGCFRGIIPHCCGAAVASATYLYIINNYYFGNNTQNRPSTVESALRVPNSSEALFRLVSWDAFSKVIAYTCSQPFFVITIRQMAQFVGGETKFNGMLETGYTIVEEEGFQNLFSGLTPRIIGTITEIVLYSSISYVIKNFILPSSFHRIPILISFFVSSFVSTFVYPYDVVGVCMAVTGSGLKAGSPPLMPFYPNWLHCWNDLQKKNQLFRGTGLFWRYYIPPNGSGISNFRKSAFLEDPKFKQFLSQQPVSNHLIL